MTPRSFVQPLKIATAAFLLAGAGLVGVQQLGAQGIAGHNSNAPVDFAADRIELQDRADRVVLAGSVVISQGDLRLRAARAIVSYTDTGELSIQRLVATGGVVVTRGNESARGNVAVYDFSSRIITMAGDVQLRRGSDTLSGGRLVMNLGTGISSVDGRASGTAASGGTGGRVSGSFSVPKRGN